MYREQIKGKPKHKALQIDPKLHILSNLAHTTTIPLVLLGTARGGK